MKNKPDYELLKDAYAIIDGIPEELISFGVPCKAKGETLTEGTICSPEGWLALHPIFADKGLSLSEDGQSICFNGKIGSVASVMAKVFGIPEDEAALLFGERDVFVNDGGDHLSDKLLWQERIRRHLNAKEILTPPVEMLTTPFVVEEAPIDQSGEAARMLH